MPNILTSLLILLLSSVAFGQPPTPTPTPTPSDDIFLQTRLEQKTLSWLIDKTRLIMANSQVKDGLKGEVAITEMPIFTLDDISTDPEFKEFQNIFSNIFKVNLKGAVIRLRIPKLAYQVKTIHANPTALSVNDPVLDLKASAFLSGITVGLSEGLQADVMIPNPKTKVLETYLTGTLDPITLTIPENVPPIQMDIHFQTIRGQDFQFVLEDYNLDSVPTYVRANKSQFNMIANATQKPLSADNIKVDPMVFRISQMTRTVKFDSFKGLLQRKLPDIENLVLDLLGGSVKKDLGPDILQSVFKSGTQSDLVIPSSTLYTRYATSSFASPAANQLQLNVQGDLCTPENYQLYNTLCVAHEPKYDPPRVISDEDKQAAHDEVTASLASGASDIVMSLSEDYLNRLLRTTINANLWDDMLKEKHLAIGPQGAFLIFNEKTLTPQLYMDVLYSGDGQGVEGILITPKHPLRFPLRFSTKLSFVLKGEKGDIPYLEINVDKLLSDANEIVYGIPEYDLPSRLIPLFRKKVANMIIKMAADTQGVNAVDMDIPDLQGVGLENTWYEVSPHGRLNLYFKL